ncbi:MAG: sulfatase [Acidobacteriota bacterium]
MLKATKGLAALLCLILSSFSQIIPLQQSSLSNRSTVIAKPAGLTNQAIPPNIIFFLTDDLDAQSISFMPNLMTLLVKEGTSFSNFFTGLSVCCPSRATILRGQYAHNHGILANKPPNGGFLKFRDNQLESSTIATWLQSAGYETVLIGKYLNGYPDNNPLYIPVGWNEWYSRVSSEKVSPGNDPNEDTVPRYFNYKLNENGRIVSYGNNPEEYLTDVEGQKALDFLQRAAGKNKPFFMYLSVNAPHKPEIPAPRHRNAFREVKTSPRTAAFNEQDVSDKPSWIRNLPLLNSKQIKRMDRVYRRRLQMLLSVDELLGNLINRLTTTGQLANTYIFFTSDNGYHLGQHRLLRGKTTLYEEDVHVPMIVRGPDVRAGQLVEELAGNVDLAPTFAELANITTPSFVDGRSLLPLLKNGSNSLAKWRESFLLERFFPIESQGKGLHTRVYKYVEYTNGERELYDLKKDPQELNNVFPQTDRALINELSVRLRRLSNCKGVDCRSAEEEPLLADR